MEAIQNFKNFIRHGKQAKDIKHNDPSITHHRNQRHAHSDSAPDAGGANFQKLNPAEYSVVAGPDNRNIVAQTGAPGKHYRNDDPGVVYGGGAGIGITAGGIVGGINPSGKYDEIMLARLIAEERETKGKLPKYPGLEQYTLLEKMGDGAFSIVYRARDNQGEYGEVAIKVVRKYELNTTQVCFHVSSLSLNFWHFWPRLRVDFSMTKIFI